jgi:hypothetical protein
VSGIQVKITLAVAVKTPLLVCAIVVEIPTLTI